MILIMLVATYLFTVEMAKGLFFALPRQRQPLAIRRPHVVRRVHRGEAARRSVAGTRSDRAARTDGRNPTGKGPTSLPSRALAAHSGGWNQERERECGSLRGQHAHRSSSVPAEALRCE